MEMAWRLHGGGGSAVWAGGHADWRSPLEGAPVSFELVSAQRWCPQCLRVVLEGDALG
eukprot:CAMPEP_0174720038 /NCGR_PEP_ID=MMETSP1094-20130205/32644_1 /TAXON_ID=156173 /ORGANISM="Chrysochromulina brevifilum, Strain UTEX LB 985" /LENGTH=57 /DNA_ID=CAMNT_0015920463 /DNA_START=89 /DNA_END=262 /DNA_ORIENTATION=-